MKKGVILLFLLITVLQLQAKVYRVLFIGNSYTAYNDLPNTFAQLSNGLGDSVYVNSNSIGSATFNMQSTNATTISLLQQGNWDFVVLQGQSQEPSFPPSQVQTQTYPYAKTLDSMAKAYNPCAEVFYYMTWGRKNGDASNCANYPPICTYAGMQQRLKESYQYMAQSNASSTAPVGIVWQKVRNTDSTIELYNPDESHPSVHGTYLAACTFYQSFFQKVIPNTAFVSAGITPAQATIIQTACKQIVLDSIPIWQQFGTMPYASFTTSIANKTISITNNSSQALSTTYSFGDGQTIANNAANVQYTYANNGNYIVVQTVTNACGKTDSATKIITINSTLALANIITQQVQVVKTNTAITFSNLPNNAVVQLYSMDGKLLYTQLATNQTAQFNLPAYNYSLLLYKIISADKSSVSGKI
jgi:PKD repeat protein